MDVDNKDFETDEEDEGFTPEELEDLRWIDSLPPEEYAKWFWGVLER